MKDPRNEYVREGYRKGTRVTEIAEALNTTKGAVVARAKRLGLTHASRNFDNVIIDTETQSSLKGDMTMKEATKAEVDALREHCLENNLPFGQHRLWWHKTKEFSVSFFDKAQVEKEEKMQADFLARIKRKAPKSKKSPVPTKTLAIPANFDVHIGKHCELIRTGREYTPDMAVKQVLEGQAALYGLTKPFGVSDILLPLGNDIVHIDSNANTTSGGTPQDAYGSVESQMYLAAELYIKSIEGFAKNHNVWLCHVHSNHDRVAGWSVSQMVAHYFHNHPRVHVAAGSMDQTHRKYFVFGNSLIMFHHGEAKEEKLLGIIKAEANEALAQTNRVYVYQGHTHHRTKSRRGMNTEIDVEKDHSGLTVIKSGNGAVNQLHVETVRSPSPADDWHSRSQFINIPSVEMFLHNNEHQFCRFTYEF